MIDMEEVKIFHDLGEIKGWIVCVYTGSRGKRYYMVKKLIRTPI